MHLIGPLIELVLNIVENLIPFEIPILFLVPVITIVVQMIVLLAMVILVMMIVITDEKMIRIWISIPWVRSD